MAISNTRSLKILIVGSNAKGSLENCYLRTLQKIGVRDIDIFDISLYGYYLSRQEFIFRAVNRLTFSISMWLAQQRLLRFLTDNEGTYNVVIVFKGMEFSRRILEACRSICPRATWVNINPDDPFNIESRGSTNSNVINSLSFYDVYFIWSRNLVRKLSERYCKRVEYLPFGYDPDFHLPPSEPVLIESNLVSFVGSWDFERETILTKLADYNLRIYGSNWQRVSKRSPIYNKITRRGIYGNDLSQVIYRSMVCLNLLRSQNKGAHNMRTFEIPAMGGLMLTTRSAEQNEFFPEGEGCLMFDNVNELRGQLDHVLENPALRQRIREQGTKLVHGNSYVDRAKLLLNVIMDVVRV